MTQVNAGDFITWLQWLGSWLGIGAFVASSILIGFRMLKGAIKELAASSAKQHGEVMGAMQINLKTASDNVANTAQLAKVLEQTQGSYQANLKMITDNHQQTVQQLLEPLRAVVEKKAAKKKRRESL